MALKLTSKIKAALCAAFIFEIGIGHALRDLFLFVNLCNQTLELAIA